MIFTLFVSVKVAFSRLIFEMLQSTISWSITAVSTWSSVRNFWCHMQSKGWLQWTMVAMQIWNLLFGSFFILRTKRQMVKTEAEPKTAFFQNRTEVIFWKPHTHCCHGGALTHYGYVMWYWFRCWSFIYDYRLFANWQCYSTISLAEMMMMMMIWPTFSLQKICILGAYNYRFLLSKVCLSSVHSA